MIRFRAITLSKGQYQSPSDLGISYRHNTEEQPSGYLAQLTSLAWVTSQIRGHKLRCLQGSKKNK